MFAAFSPVRMLGVYFGYTKTPNFSLGWGTLSLAFQLPCNFATQATWNLHFPGSFKNSMPSYVCWFIVPLTIAIKPRQKRVNLAITNTTICSVPRKLHSDKIRRGQGRRKQRIRNVCWCGKHGENAGKLWRNWGTIIVSKYLISALAKSLFLGGGVLNMWKGWFAIHFKIEDGILSRLPHIKLTNKWSIMTNMRR